MHNVVLGTAFSHHEMLQACIKWESPRLVEGSSPQYPLSPPNRTYTLLPTYNMLLTLPHKIRPYKKKRMDRRGGGYKSLSVIIKSHQKQTAFAADR